MEERVISLKKDRVITLSKSGTTGGEKILFAYTGLRWGKVRIGGNMIGRETITVTEKKYTGNFLQRLFKFGPYTEITKEVVIRNGYTEPVTYKDVDLDSSILMYDENKKLVDRVYFGKRNSDDRSIYHYGDDTVGGTKGDSDNEMIRIEFSKVSAKTKYLVMILNSYSHDKFDDLPFAQMRIYSSDQADAGSKMNAIKTFAEYKIDNNPEFIGKEALVLGVFYRSGRASEWDFKAVGTSTSERTIAQMEKGSALDAVKAL